MYLSDQHFIVISILLRPTNRNTDRNPNPNHTTLDHDIEHTISIPVCDKLEEDEPFAETVATH